MTTDSRSPGTALAHEDAPLTRFHLRVTVAGTGGQFSDGFILGIIGIVITAATKDLALTPLWVGLLGAAALVGLFFGAVITGPIADRVGRRHIFAWDMLAFAGLSLAQFFVQNAEQLLVLRLLLGLVLGADYVVSKSLVTEHAPRAFRGRLMSLLAVAWAAGYVFAYLVGFLLTGHGDDAWRYMLAISAVPALLVFAFRTGIPESPLWLVQHGREEEAAAVVRRIHGPAAVPPTAAPATSRRGFRTLFSPAYRRRTAVGALFYVCQVVPFFALGTFSSQVMEALGVTSKLGAGALYNVFLLAGAVFGLLIIDRISRRRFLIGTFVIGGVLLAALTAFGAGSGPVVPVALFTALRLRAVGGGQPGVRLSARTLPHRPAGLGRGGRGGRQPHRLGSQHVPAARGRGQLRHHRRAGGMRGHPPARRPRLLGMGPGNEQGITGQPRRPRLIRCGVLSQISPSSAGRRRTGTTG
ncbi:MFS transporter [Streptomyces demainii]|uniref:MFS transporter n=1 Tax=Streptomyces demainii TaxID=588122 RepID=A0ABT9KJR7_9ACTN|nr:MFS transporter [Streptomyces demainii]MDP9608420.1 putative MFS transporter [Streptomyces demainii]